MHTIVSSGVYGGDLVLMWVVFVIAVDGYG